MKARRAVLTIDLEEGHHGVERCSPDRYGTFPDRLPDLVPRILDELEAHGARATFFVLGRVAEDHPGLVERIASRGHEIGSHGYDHRRYSRLSQEEVRRDLASSRRAIERAGAEDIAGFRAPFFSVRERDMDWFSGLLEGEGFEYDASLIGPGHPGFGEQEAPNRPTRFGDIHEVPVPTHWIGGLPVPVGGSFFFRLLPYAVTRYVMNDFAARAGGTPILYFHPWEFEPGSWRLWRLAGLRAKFVHFWGRRRFPAKFGCLLDEVQTMPMRDYLEDLS